MKTLTLSAIRCSLIFTAVAALSIVYPTSVQAVPTTYQYTGNPFTSADPPYTTSDFVAVILTLASPLGANMPLTRVTPTAFRLSDGVQTITFSNGSAGFDFATDASGAITEWRVFAVHFFADMSGLIETTNFASGLEDFGEIDNGIDFNFGSNGGIPGVWVALATVPDAGSTLSLMTLTLMALGLVARRFQRAAA